MKHPRPFALTSSAFVENGVIPIRYSGDGDNVSPPLEWSGAPEGTESFVLTLADPDVPFGEEVPVYGLMPPPGPVPGDLFIHWMAVDTPADSSRFPMGPARETCRRELASFRAASPSLELRRTSTAPRRPHRS